MNRKKVIVVGAGLAGCAAALSAYENGSSVEVIESRTRRSIIEGETTSFEALQNLTQDGDALELISKMGFDIEPEATYIGARIYPPSGKHLDFRLDRPHGYFIRRRGEGSMDHQMIERIERADMKIEFGTRVERATPDGRLTISKGDDRFEMRADIIIGADGRSTTVGKGIASPLYGKDIAIGIGCHFKGPHGFEPGIAQCWLGSKLCPGEYSYVLPSREEVTVVTTMRPHMVPKGTPYTQYLERFLEIPSIREGLGSSRRICDVFGSVPVTPGRRFGKGRILLAGESARLTDPLLGFGIKNAILSGHLAGSSIAHVDPVKEYTTWINERIVPDLRKRMRARETIMDSLEDHQIDQMVSMIEAVISGTDPDAFFDSRRRKALGSGIWSLTRKGYAGQAMKLLIPLVRANFSLKT